MTAGQRDFPEPSDWRQRRLHPDPARVVELGGRVAQAEALERHNPARVVTERANEAARNRKTQADRKPRASVRDHVTKAASKIREEADLSSLRWRAARGRTHVANAWYRAAGRRIHGARQGISNARNQRTLERGRRPRTTQAADVLRSSVPFYRNRISPATGRPNRMARELGRTTDASLAKMAPRIRAERAAQTSAAGRHTDLHPLPARSEAGELAARVTSRARNDRFLAQGRSPGRRSGRKP